ncbi:sensor histidine kinase [Leifsonia shinshuensis]|uniref:sensor histidine kinase n=1 Tax=Leifsonia shinshuensis TaxID=150026 RepID=UPI0036D24BBD
MGYRRQLAVTTGGIVLAGGAILLITQYLVLQRLLAEAVTEQNRQAESSRSSAGLESAEDPPASPLITHGPRWTQEDPVVSEVLAGMLWWSGFILALATAVAIVGSRLVSKAPFRRIASVTSATNAITERDLSKRLHLDGPDDEITRLGSAIDAMVERLEGAFLRQEAFIANASHELRTPLTTARVALQLAIREQRVPADLRPDIDRIFAANRRLEELVDALLIVAQGRALADLPRSPVELAALIRRTVADCADPAARRELAVSCELPSAPVTVTGNPSLLQSLVANLVGNAIRHNVDRGFVRIRVSADHERVDLVVENSGPIELTAEQVAHLSEPFHRGDRSRLRPDDGGDAGSGLGLTLVESIATLHGGAVSLTARRGGGLTAAVALPTSPRRAPEGEVTAR